MTNIVAKGIDVSSWQGNVDFGKVKAAGYSFVIIKAGQGLKEMQTFKGKYLPGVLEAGLDWGAYWWSDAMTVEEARQEARAFVKALDGLKPTYPAYMDQEYDSPCGKWGVNKGKELRTQMALSFMQELQNAGYYAGLYASVNWLQQWICVDKLSAFDKWVAQYAAKCTYHEAYGMWQHHGDCPGFVGKVAGVVGPVDLNDCYRDYPKIIRAAGLNGWTRPETPEAPEAPDDSGSYLVYGLVETFDSLREAKRFAAEQDAKTMIVCE